MQRDQSTRMIPSKPCRRHGLECAASLLKDSTMMHDGGRANHSGRVLRKPDFTTTVNQEFRLYLNSRH
jgi:hypothetical protein